MDANVEILRPPVADYRLRGLQRRNQTWQGLASAESKTHFDWGPHFTVQIVGQPPPLHVLRVLDPRFRVGDWHHLSISGDGLDLYWAEQRGVDIDWHGNDFEGLLRALLCDSMTWAFVLEWGDSFRDVSSMDVEGLICRLRESLAYGRSSRGFVAYQLTTELG